MGKLMKNTVKIISRITIVLFNLMLVTCAPITESLVAAVEDEYAPIITVTSPDDNSNYYSTVIVEGTIEDDAITSGDGKGSVSSLSFTASSLLQYCGYITVDTEGNVTQVTSKGEVLIDFNASTGDFSFEMDTNDFSSSSMQIDITAVDFNGNESSTNITLRESDGPYIVLDGFASSTYVGGDEISITGIVGNSYEDYIGGATDLDEVSLLTLDIPELGVDESEVYLDVAAAVDSGETGTISVHSSKSQGFDFELNIAARTFSAVMTLPSTVPSSLNITVGAEDRNGHGYEDGDYLSKNDGTVQLSIVSPTSSPRTYFSTSNAPSVDFEIWSEPGYTDLYDFYLTAASSGTTTEQTSGFTYDSSTQYVTGSINLFSHSSNVTLTAKAASSSGSDYSQQSITVYADNNGPVIDITDFNVGDGDAYAHYGETVEIQFTVTDSLSGYDTSDVPTVTIGEDSITPTLSGSLWTASYTLPSKNANSSQYDSYNNSNIPFTITAEDVLGNSTSIDETLSGDAQYSPVVYYHDVPDDADIDIVVENTDNAAYSDYAVSGDDLGITVDVGRVLDLSASEFLLIFDGGDTEEITLSATGTDGVYSGSLTINDSSHAEGSVDYEFTYADVAGNASSDGAFHDEDVLTLDYTGPTISITNVSPIGAVEAGTVVTVTFTAKDDGTNITDSDDITVTFGGASAASVGYGSGVWTATYTPTTVQSSALAIKVTADDFLGNQNSVTNSTSITSIVDTTPPVVTITGVSPSGGTVEVGTLITATFTVVDGSTVVTTGLDTSNVTFGGNAAASVGYGSGVWTAAYTPTATSSSFSIVVTAEDSAGNEGSDTETISVVDTTPPVVTITGVSPSGGTVEVGTLITATFTVVDGSTVVTTGLDTSNVTFGGNAAASVGYSSTDSAWKATYTPTATSSSFSIVVTAEDSAGNEGSDTETISVVDTTPPVVTITGVSPTGSVSAGTTITVTFTVVDGSTAVTTGLDTSNVTFSTASGTASAASVGYSGGAWTATYVPAAAVSPLTISVTAEDAAGNEGSATDNTTITSVTE